MLVAIRESLAQNLACLGVLEPHVTLVRKSLEILDLVLSVWRLEFSAPRPACGECKYGDGEDFHFMANVKVMAPLPAGAEVETGVDA